MEAAFIFRSHPIHRKHHYVADILFVSPKHPPRSTKTCGLHRRTKAITRHLRDTIFDGELRHLDVLRLPYRF